ncbi:MAG: hypothetical protein SOU37_01440 [Campylobacter lanienae]|nr:hypothetical protein [Campylobacteraceae bacterium]MDY2817264.1 hypothetical protein [Campylobacter lanienae]
MTKAFLVIHSGGNLSKSQVKEQALKELKARYDEYREPCICVVFDKDNKGIYLGIANEGGAKIEGFPLFMDIQTLDINRAEQSSTGSEPSTAEQSSTADINEQSHEASTAERAEQSDEPSTAERAEQSSTASTAVNEQSHAINEQNSVPANSLNIDTSNFALKSELDVFDTQAYKSEVNAFIAEAKKEVVTLGQLDEFDANAYKQELQTIANEVTNKMAVFDGLSELDLAELKAQLKTELKAEILAELRG